MTDRNLAGQRFGEFVLREQIAEGGSGAVYRSDQPRLNREVVVKVLRDARRHHRGAQARFQREAQLASRLDHPFAVHVYAFGLDHDTWWIAMELVPGITLDAWLQRRGPMPLEQFAPFFECLADVVHCMHERGIVHRDLKPSNVMVVHSGDRLIPKLLDLGIAKAPQDSPLAWPEGSLAESRPKGDVTRTDPAAKDWNLTPSGIGIGSSAYMAPEQWDSASTVGPASDIYALGVLAYKALTGRAPFTGTSTGEYYLHHKQTPVPPVGGDLPRSLDAIFQRALAKQPGDRYPTALAFAAELGAAMRASERALLRSHAEQWQTQARPAALLLQGDVLAEVERWTERTRPELTPLECSYFASSQRRARRAARLRRAAIVLAAVAIVGTSLGVLQYRAAMRTELAEQQTRTARQLTEATIVQSEIEQGRAALLHGEPEAFAHLAEAYRRGDHSPATSFMLARAIQPRLQEQARLPSSSGRMWSAAFSPDGTQIVTTDEHNAQLWDAQSFQRQHLLPHDQQVFGAAYSRDGTQLATASVSTVKLWDPRTGRLLRELRHPSAGRKPVEYFRVAISPDNRWVAAITLAGAVAHLWDAASGEVIADIANDGFEHPGIAFAGDGRWLVTGSGDDVRVFDIRARKPGLVLSGLHVLRWALDPTGPRLAIGTTGGEISIRDLATGAPLHMLRTAGSAVDVLAFSPDGQRLATASHAGERQIWDTGSGKLQAEPHSSRTETVATEFSRDSQQVLMSGSDGTIVIADAASGTTLTTLEGAKARARSVHFSSRSDQVVSATLDGVRVWDATARYRQWGTPVIAEGCGVVFQPQPDSRFLAIGCRHHGTLVYDTSDGHLLANLPGASWPDDDINAVFPVVSSDGHRAAIARDKAVEVFELPSGHLLQTIEQGAAVRSVAFDPASGDLLSGGSDGSVLVSRADGTRLALAAVPAAIDVVAFLPDARIVSSDARGSLRIYDHGGTLAATIQLPVRATALRSRGTRLVAMPADFAAHPSPTLVDLQHARLVANLDGHAGFVFSARWIDDRLLTTAGDGALRMWDGSDGRLLQTFRVYAGYLADATMSADGRLLIAGGADGVMRFWDIATGRLLWQLQAHDAALVGIQLDGNDIVTRGFSGDLARWHIPSTEHVIATCGAQSSCASPSP